ncbi:hypothetical protein ACLX1H_000983 [Fusarium chlamydosporum]
MSTSEPIDVDGREACYDSSEEHRNSNRGWAGNIDLQLWDIPPSSSHRASKQKASTASSSDLQFKILMEEQAALREMMEQNEEKIAELYYKRQQRDEISSHTLEDDTRQGVGSVQMGFGGRTRRESHPASSAYTNDSLETDVKGKVKKRKAKRPKTEEEQNRHINKVFMRENMNRI